MIRYIMSATEIIAKIQELPLPEQKRVLSLLEDSLRKRESDENIRFVKDPEFRKSAETVLNEHADLFRRLAQ